MRQAFLQFFEDRGHLVVPSSSLVPGKDPSLLFTNAGMVPFKDVFLGLEKPPAASAVSAQRCLRAGGKHNDLDNVGYTARHHTFFEMLGNFSWGGYFKEEAIALAWEFLTEVAGLDAERMLATVHRDDDQSAAVWRERIGLPAERVLWLGDDSNFWAMAETGPCGPCSEVFFDHGEGVAGGPPGSADEEGDRWVEIWNLVFMQYERRADGEMVPLPQPCVDTGMGLERLAAAVQGRVSNYDSDLFVPLMQEAARLLGLKGGDAAAASSLRVIADHIRALCFLIADGVLPSNEGRGYVLRRILRRAARHGHRLGAREPFLHALAPALIAQMGAAWPLLREASGRIGDALGAEEEQFSQALERGMQLLRERLEAHPGEPLPGELVFKLHDTYGFPVDMTADFAREQGIEWDQGGYEREMEQQQARSRASASFGGETVPGLAGLAATEFTGYDGLQGEGKVLGLWRDSEPVERLEAGQSGYLALDRSPFYARAGGQVGDSGELSGDGVAGLVLDCHPEGGIHLHRVEVQRGRLRLGDTVRLSVDAERRAAIMRNHSATHLLHSALRRVLGQAVQQRGSRVGPDSLRFDFSHPNKPSRQELAEVERLVDEQVGRDAEVRTEEMDKQAALEAGALAMFDEKYGERVRVLSMGEQGGGAAAPFSIELCGGTHVSRTGDIGPFRIVSESSIAAGIRRIEAITGAEALDWYRTRATQVDEIAAQLRCGPEEVVGHLQKRLQAAAEEGGHAEPMPSYGTELTIGGARVQLALASGVADVRELRRLRGALTELAQRLAGVWDAAQPPDLKVLAAPVHKGGTAMLAEVAAPWQQKVSADQLARAWAEAVGGKGGGKPDFAQAGGGDSSKIPAALRHLTNLLRQHLT